MFLSTSNSFVFVYFAKAFTDSELSKEVFPSSACFKVEKPIPTASAKSY